MPCRRHKQPEWQAKTWLPPEARPGTVLQAQPLAQADQVAARAARLQLAAAVLPRPPARAASQPAAAASELRTARVAAQVVRADRVGLVRVPVNPAPQLQAKAAVPEDRPEAQAWVKPGCLQLVAAQ